ncbi:Amine N-MethylTransferase [Aphelenchoides besseyi]|nr:Amine N-MethylTransferase [Aphelenchoides besseyi]
MGHQTCEVQAENTDNEVDWDEKPLLTRDHFHEEFSTEAYLKDFYTKVDDPAMQMVLTFLPGIAARLPDCESMLDFGAGPTIHASICLRNRVKKIYLADYLPQNRDELQKWLDGRSTFDWTRVLRMIATGEGIGWEKTKEMEEKTRSKIEGILFCNCLEDPVLTAPVELLGTFGVVVSIFTIEYCSMTTDEYRNAIRRVVELIRPGGYFILAGILEETWCSFGGRKFSCCYITREFMLQCLQDAGLIIDFENRQATILFEVNGMFMIAAQKTKSDA